MDDVRCGHCKRPVVGLGIAADGTILCHGLFRSCYQMVTVYKHSTDGSCCEGREDDGDDEREAPVLAA
jgi:hypothetical protein